MKIIFLDIDGVLNSNQWFHSDAYKKASAGIPIPQIMLIRHDLHLDPQAVLTLNDLVTKSGAEVVLSSTWRVKYSPEEMTKMLQDKGATFTIKASTPQLFGKISSRIPRGKEINAYLSKLAEQPESFVILDDNSDMLNLGKFLVLTDEKFGIIPTDVEKALKILNGEVE